MSDGLHIEAHDLHFSYPDGPSALYGLSVEIKAGDFVAIIGQNGSGKSTLAKHINGLLRPTQGQILLNGEDVHNQSVSNLARRVGYVFQNPDHQIFSPTVREEIAVGPQNVGLSDTEVQQRVSAVLEVFDLTTYADRQPAILSFGLRRKISVAAVVAMQTPLLILDEPTVGLDKRSVTDLMQHIVNLHQQGNTIILITHDMRVVADYVPRCIVLHHGRLLTQGDTRSVFKEADLLRQTHIELPQITTLSRRMANMPDDTLTVSEFCESIGPSIVNCQSQNANCC